MPADADPGLPLFVGGMLATICLFVAGLTYYVVGRAGEGAIAGLSLGIAGLGGGFFLLGALGAAFIWRRA